MGASSRWENGSLVLIYPAWKLPSMTGSMCGTQASFLFLTTSTLARWKTGSAAYWMEGGGPNGRKPSSMREP